MNLLGYYDSGTHPVIDTHFLQVIKFITVLRKLRLAVKAYSGEYWFFVRRYIKVEET